MPYTVRQAVMDLLRFLDAEQRTLPAAAAEDDPVPACLSAVHGALSELSTLGPPWQFRARRSAVIHAPVTVTIPSVGQEASSFALSAPTWQDWMLGCSIQIGNEPWNEITGREGTTVTLLHPVLDGFGANVSARVYGDCVRLPANVMQVMGPVTIADHYELRPAHNLSQIHQALYDCWRNEDYGRDATMAAARRRTVDSPGPRLYWHDMAYDGTSAPASSRLRLGPMPQSRAILHYRARLSSPRFTEDDVYVCADPSTDPGTVIPVREDLIDTVFLPIARQRFTASPLFRNDSALGELKRQYEAAHAIARQMQPQAAAGSVVCAGF